MALDLALLGRTGVQAVAALINYTLATNIDPNWITCTGAGSPFQPLTTVNVVAITTPDSQGNVSPYTGSQLITYNRAGFQKAFQGLNITLNMKLPFTIGQAVAQLKTQYGIVLEQADIQNSFADQAQLDGLGYVILKPGTNSLRFYIDFSPFALKLKINQSSLTDLQKLVAMTNEADMDALNAANTPPSNVAPPVPQPPNSTP